MENLKNARYIESPSRNFCILNSSVMNDPKDGKDKLMFTSFVAGGTGIFAIVDPVTNEGESYDFPCDNGAWAVCRVDERRVAIGTCGTKGAIHTFDLIDRKFIKTTYAKDNQYVWNLVKASDGNLYGGTYPGNEIVKYSPETMEAEIMTRCDSDPENLYSRTVYPDYEGSGNIKVACTQKTPNICIYNIYEKRVVKNIPGKLASVKAAHINEKFFAVTTGDGYSEYTKEGITYFDSVTCEPISSDSLPEVPVQKDDYAMSNGGRAVVYKQGYKYTDSEGNTVLRRFPVIPPATAMHTITCDANGKLWGSSGFGQTICSLDPDTGEFMNTNVVTNNGGEVYGIVPLEDRIYLTAYAGGMHIVYYPDKEWNQEDNINPNTFRLLSGDGYIRPETRSYMGPGGYIYTGFLASYGVYGGALTRIDPETNEVLLWKNTENDCGITSLFFDSKYIYAVTTTRGNGLPPRNGVPTYVMKLDRNFNVIETKSFDNFNLLGKDFVNGKVYLGIFAEGKSYLVTGDDGMESYTLKEISDLRLDNLTNLCGTDKLIFHSGNRIYTMDFDGGNITPVCEADERITHFTVSRNGRVFFACQSKVFEAMI